MNAYMICAHNLVVGKEDRVYHLGDFCFSNRHLEILSNLNGKHVLIKGNHDKLKMSQYSQYFDDVRGTHQLDGFILSHIPLHPASLTRWPVNIHGHLHSYNVTKEDGSIDNRYFSVCVEQPHMNYAPISLEQIKRKIAYDRGI
jgi:calcineurin-like phosphoesterase family protein